MCGACGRESQMNETVTISKVEYERLIDAAEDLADIVAFDRAMAQAEESVPAEFVKLMVELEYYGPHFTAAFRYQKS